MVFHVEMGVRLALATVFPGKHIEARGTLIFLCKRLAWTSTIESLYKFLYSLHKEFGSVLIYKSKGKTRSDQRESDTEISLLSLQAHAQTGKANKKKEKKRGIYTISVLKSASLVLSLSLSSFSGKGADERQGIPFEQASLRVACRRRLNSVKEGRRGGDDSCLTRSRPSSQENASAAQPIAAPRRAEGVYGYLREPSRR